MTTSRRARVDTPWLGGVEAWAATHRWVSDVLGTVGVAAVLGSLTLNGARGIAWHGGWGVVLVLGFVVLHLSVAARVRAPAAAFALASLAMFAIVLTPNGRVIHPAAGGLTEVPALFLPSSLVFLVLLYSAAARLPVTISRVALVIALVGGLIATVRTLDAVREVSAGGWLVGAYVGLALGVTVLATWSLGRLAAIRRQRGATERAEGARLAVLEERARISREMHDIVAHSLAVIVRQAEGGAFVARRAPEQAEQALQTIADTGRGALSDMRGLLGILSEPGNAPGPPQPTLADLPELVAGVRGTGIAAELIVVGAPFEVGAATELAAYRLAQECLTNAVKYAGPRARVDVTVHWGPAELAIDVTDDGGGGGGRLPVPGAGAGLPGLRDRVAAVGGSFQAAPNDRGFRVRAGFPRPTGSGTS